MAINLRDSYSKVTWDLGSKKMKAEPWGKTDDTGRGIIVTIAQDSVIITPTTETLRMYFLKPDGTDGYIPSTIVGGKFIIENMSQVFAVPGKVNAELEFNDGTEFIKSISFTIDVYESQQSGNIVSSNDYSALQVALGKVSNLEGNYAPRLGSVESQLADRATKAALDVEKARINGFTALTVGSTTGDAELIDARVGIDGKTYANAGGAVRGQIGNLIKNLNDNTSDIPFVWALGNLDATNGAAEQTSTVRFRTGFYKFPTDKITFVIPDGIVCMYYEFSTLQVYEKYSQIPANKILTVDSTKYYRFLCRNSTTTAFNISVLDGLSAKYNINTNYQYQKYIELLDLINSVDNVDKLNGKTLIAVGDSITYGANNNGVSYAHKVASRHSMGITRYAVSGATIVKTLQSGSEILYRSCIREQVDSAILAGIAPDYFIISGGYNDAQTTIQNAVGALVPTGNGTPAYNGVYDINTFIGAIESIIYKIKMAFPYAKILYVITYPVSAQFRWMTIYAPAVREVCKKWAVPYVDFTAVGNMVCNSNLPEYTNIFTDGLHPNDYGNELMANYVETEMKNM